MGQLETFLQNFDLTVLAVYLVRALVALFCLVCHELAHGYTALRLGDTTAQRAGRLTLNPIAHIDPLGLLLMIFAGVGWAKPVPVDMRNFRHPKRGMALTALAGPVCNFVIALAALGVGSLLCNVFYQGDSLVLSYAILLCLYTAALSAGLGVFNLFPIPPLDGSKVLFSLLPDRAYLTILKYERYVMLALFALIFFGVLDAPLSLLLGWVLRALCAVTGFPQELLALVGAG